MEISLFVLILLQIKFIKVLLLFILRCIILSFLFNIYLCEFYDFAIIYLVDDYSWPFCIPSSCSWFTLNFFWWWYYAFGTVCYLFFTSVVLFVALVLAELTLYL